MSFKMIAEQNISSLRESIGVIKNIPMKMSTHNDKKANKDKIFEEFFIIGVDKNNVTDADLIDMRPLPPKNLYMYNQDIETTTCQRRAVVKDFCFPNGVEIKNLKKSRAKKILYGNSSGNLREKFFVFTL